MQASSRPPSHMRSRASAGLRQDHSTTAASPAPAARGAVPLRAAPLQPPSDAKVSCAAGAACCLVQTAGERAAVGCCRHPSASHLARPALPSLLAARPRPRWTRIPTGRGSHRLPVACPTPTCPPPPALPIAWTLQPAQLWPTGLAAPATWHPPRRSVICCCCNIDGMRSPVRHEGACRLMHRMLLIYTRCCLCAMRAGLRVHAARRSSR